MSGARAGAGGHERAYRDEQESDRRQQHGRDATEVHYCPAQGKEAHGEQPPADGYRPLVTPVPQRRAQPRVIIQPVVQPARSPTGSPGREEHERCGGQARNEHADQGESRETVGEEQVGPAQDAASGAERTGDGVGGERKQPTDDAEGIARVGGMTGISAWRCVNSPPSEIIGHIRDRARLPGGRGPGRCREGPPVGSRGPGRRRSGA